MSNVGENSSAAIVGSDGVLLSDPTTATTTETVISSTQEVEMLTNIHYDIMVLIFIVLVVWCSEKIKNGLRSMKYLSKK